MEGFAISPILPTRRDLYPLMMLAPIGMVLGSTACAMLSNLLRSELHGIGAIDPMITLRNE